MFVASGARREFPCFGMDRGAAKHPPSSSHSQQPGPAVQLLVGLPSPLRRHFVSEPQLTLPRAIPLACSMDEPPSGTPGVERSLHIPFIPLGIAVHGAAESGVVVEL